MADISNELIYEVLKAMQARLGNIEDGLHDLRAELHSVRTHMQAVQIDVGNLYTVFGSLDQRVSRIERRLDLAETAAQ